MSSKSLLWSLPLIGRGTTSQSRPAAVSNRRSIALSRQSRFVSSRGLGNYAAAGLVVTVVIMMVAYVFGINQSAAKGYEITKQRNKLNALIEDNKKLMVRTAEVGSILRIQDEALANHLVQINNQEYLRQTQLTQR